MTDYLLGLSVGPVQGFIAAARRTRDLWFGSHLLSEISKSVALAWHCEGARLIFPAPESESDLHPKSNLDVGNKVMAVITTNNPRHIIEKGKDAARTHWTQVAHEALQKLEECVHPSVWDLQINDILELYGAWVPLSDGSNGYKKARSRLEQLLGARKSTRDFQPASTDFRSPPGFGLPKSSLDAARETVLKKKLPTAFRRKLGLAPGEQVDCPGLVKRIGGDPEQFPPVTRIALEAWLDQEQEPDLTAFNKACEPFISHGLITRVRPSRFQKLPFDGAFLFSPRIEAESHNLADEEKHLTPSLETLKRARDQLHKYYGTPTQYFSLLVADGDSMGAFIDRHDDEGAHVRLTQALASYARQAREIVERNHGACVYAGGDDVLALLPIHRAITCANTLREAFSNTLSSLASTDHPPPSLSVGLGLGHVLTPFNRLLDLGRRAEILAKEGAEGTPLEDKRNALALIVGVRSGAETSVRGKWDPVPGQRSFAERLQQWTNYYRTDQLSDKTPYDLREVARALDWARERSDYNEIAAQEVERVLDKKRVEGGTQELTIDVKSRVSSAVEANGFQTTIQELLVARWLSQKAKE